MTLNVDNNYIEVLSPSIIIVDPTRTSGDKPSY